MTEDDCICRPKRVCLHRAACVDNFIQTLQARIGKLDKERESAQEDYLFVSGWRREVDDALTAIMVALVARYPEIAKELGALVGDVETTPSGMLGWTDAKGCHRTCELPAPTDPTAAPPHSTEPTAK